MPGSISPKMEFLSQIFCKWPQRIAHIITLRYIVSVRLISLALFLCWWHCYFDTQLAAEFAIKAVQQDTSASSVSIESKPGSSHLPVFTGSSFTDFSFYSSHVYNTDSNGAFVYQRRVHFISENRSEVIAYAANILIRCFHVWLFNFLSFFKKKKKSYWVFDNNSYFDL